MHGIGTTAVAATLQTGACLSLILLASHGALAAADKTRASGFGFYGDQRGCYWAEGRRYCARYCYWEVDGVRYTRELISDGKLNAQHRWSLGRSEDRRCVTAGNRSTNDNGVLFEGINGKPCHLSGH